MSMRAFIFTLFTLVAPMAALAESKGGSSLGSYTIEIAPMVGINLPYDIWGIEGTLNVYGIQTAYSLNEADALTASVLMHTKANDTAYTVDGGYRREINSALFHAFFDVGLHYSMFKLKTDYDSDGACIPSNCLTDSGTYIGIYGGSGIVIPFGTMTLARVGFRFYNNPQAWVLLSAGLGLRY